MNKWTMKQEMLASKSKCELTLSKLFDILKFYVQGKCSVNLLKIGYLKRPTDTQLTSKD